MSHFSPDETLQRINTMSATDARDAFGRCCGSSVWTDAMVSGRPYARWEELEAARDAAWARLTEADWREAFAHHPPIGDLESLRTRFGDTRAWARGEQAGTATASEATLQALTDGNAAYKARFGYIFIVCATGKSADEMLRLLQERLSNSREKELPIAAGEQTKITDLRLRKL